MFILLAPVLTLFGEALFTIAIRGGQEYRFISPCIALYLGSVVPAIWFLELKSYEERLERHVCQDTRAWLKLSNASSNAGCEFRFANEVRQDFSKNIKVDELVENLDERRNMPDYPRNFSDANMMMDKVKIAEYVEGLVDLDCEGIQEPLVEYSDAGTTLWKKEGECIPLPNDNSKFKKKSLP